MRPVKQTVSGTNGYTPWVRVNQLQPAMFVGLSVIPTSNANLTWGIQHTHDDPGPQGLQAASVTRSGTTATIIIPNHGASIGDSLTVIGTGSSNLDGTYDVASVVDQNTLTYAVANSGATADQGGARVSILRVFQNLNLWGSTGRGEGWYNYHIQALRLKVTNWVAGAVDLIVQSGAMPS